LPQFHGGIHPPGNKSFTDSKPVVKANLPSKVIVHLQQHVGVPATPVVSVGDEVKVGQPIGEAKGFVSASVHASVSGKVVSVAPAPHPVGRVGIAVGIESDGKDEWFYTKETSEFPTRQQIKKLFQEFGIVGLGGATFPTHVKVSPPQEKKIDTYIVNGAECEPYLTTDHRLMLERPRDLVKGLLILLHIMEVSRGIIAIEENKADAILAVRDVVEGKDFGGYTIEVVSMPVRYPQGAEKQLIYALLGREIPTLVLWLTT